MQTFLPYSDFYLTASCLDRARLGKQRVEALQILQTLSGRPSTWSNHPAVRMWRGAERFLCVYGMIICSEWIQRGYRDSCFKKIASFRKLFPKDQTPPVWITKEFTEAHQSNLLRKYPEWYQQFGWEVPNNLEYIWPV